MNINKFAYIIHLWYWSERREEGYRTKGNGSGLPSVFFRVTTG